MRSAARRGLAAALALAATGGVAWLSGVPVAGTADEARAGVRLSWRIRGDAGASECRRPTAEELAELPSHMRNPDACVGPGVAFALSVALDGREVVADTVEPAGARGDRPIFVLRDLPVDPGSHRVRVRFEALGGAGGPAHEIDEVVDVAAGRTVLITWDAGAERLVVRER